jgi:hypothetical protein
LDEFEKMLQEVILRLQARNRKAESAFILEKDLAKSLHRFKSQFVSRLVKQESLRMAKSKIIGDIYFQGPENKECVLILANISGNEPFSVLSLLMFLSENSQHAYRIFASPSVEMPNLDKKVSPSLAIKLMSLIESERIKKVIVIRDGLPHFDAFHLAIAGERTRTAAEGLIEHLRRLGYETGKYSLRDDAPTYQIVKSKNPLLTLFEAHFIESFGFTVTERVETCVEALTFLTNRTG